MKIDKKELEEFEARYKKITSKVENIITQNECNPDEFMDAIESDMNFLDSLSSVETFRKNYNLINHAFENRNNRKLIERINQKKGRKKQIRIYSATIGAAAAIALISFWISGVDKPQQPILNEKIAELKVPTLFVDNTQQITLDVNNRKIVAKDYDRDTVSTQRLVIPKGYLYTILLEDSTEVTLNANSELIYPTNFGDSVRRVQLKGEGYFKVKKDLRPFIVSSFDLDVKVYGTQFNLKARNYSKIEAVLVEGAVGVTVSGGSEVRMKPNQHYSYDRTKGVSELTEIDCFNFTQWMESNFAYDNYSLTDVLTDLEAWYNITFDGKEAMSDIKVTFFSTNETSVSKILNVIEKITDVKFIKEGGERYRVMKE